MKKRFKRKKGPVRSKKVTFDGIQFASGLEKYMYQALKKAKIKAQYEKRSFELQPSFEIYDSGGNAVAFDPPKMLYFSVPDNETLYGKDAGKNY